MAATPQSAYPATYHNTTRLTGEALRQAIVAAAHQGDAVLAIYRASVLPLSPSQVWECGKTAGRKWLLTSVRRSINTLAGEGGPLVKLDRKRVGLYGRPEFLWALAGAGHGVGDGEGTGVYVEAA